MATSQEAGVGLDDSNYSAELDCNDNSPRLGMAQEDVYQVSGENSPHAMCNGGNVVGGVRRGSFSQVADANVNGQMTHQGSGIGGGITLSSEDTLNNDFFFDDEFTIPFDANITDAQVENDYNNGSSQMIDSAEIDEIIKRGSRKNGMCSSKSDSCLYQADIEASVGSELYDQNMSQEMTPSEKDISSSDLSENLHSGRLFSPPNEQTSLTGASESDLNNSFLSAEEKFQFDWKATKDQYKISFDKNLAKYSSDESSFCEGTSTPGGRVLTTWAIQRGGSAWDSQSSGSYSSSKKSSSNNIPQDMQANSSNKRLSKFDKQLRKKLEKTKADMPSEGKKESNRALTTWKAVTSPTHTSSNSDSAKSEGHSPLSLWKCTKGSAQDVDQGVYDSNDGTIQKQPRSASLPNMRYDHKLKCFYNIQENTGRSNKSSGSSDYKTCSEGQEIKVDANSEECEDDHSARNSRPTSLLELFQRSKSQSGSDCSNASDHHHHINLISPDTAAGVINIYKEAMVSPNSMKRLTGTWSMSTISSGRRSQVVLSPDKDDELAPNVSLKRWGTAQNLPDLSEDLNPDSDQDFLSGSEADLSVSGHSVSSSASDHKNSPRRGYLSHCNCELSGCLDCSGQVGSGYMTDSYSNDKLDHSAQWPPCTCTTSIQTSLEYPGGNFANNMKYKVVDTALQTHLKEGSGKPYSSRVSKMYSIPAVKKSPKDARDRLAHSMFSQKSALPDLSFLNNLSVTASGVLRATMSSPNLRQSNTKSCQTSITTEPTPSFARRFQKRSVSTSPGSSRESSPSTTHLRRPRSNSVSTNTSACSSSSSGIDPGYSSCDSQLNKMTHWFGDIPEHLLSQIPEWLVHRIAYSDRGLCVVCRVKLLQGALSKDSIASVNSSHLDNETSQQSTATGIDDTYKKAKGTNGSPVIKQASPSVNIKVSSSSENPTAASQIEGVKLRNKNLGERKEGRPQSVPDMEILFDDPVVRRPLKSCLRRNPGDRNKVAMKHRSWSDPFDATVLRYSQDGETRYQLVTNVPAKPCWPGEINNGINQKPYSTARDSVEFHKTHHYSSPSTRLCKNDLLGNNCYCSIEHESSTHSVLNVSNAVPSKTVKSCNVGPASPASSQSHTSSDDASGETVILNERVTDREGTEVKISPDKIQVPPCACGTSHAVLHSSSDSGETSNDLASRNGKKSVKFAEKVFYHSPNSSPHQSPKRIIENNVAMGITGVQKRFPLSRDMVYKIQDIDMDQGNSRHHKQCSDISNNSPPPGEFLISNPLKVTSPSSSTIVELEQQILSRKKAMVQDVTRAADLLLYELARAKDSAHLDKLSSTRENAQIGHIILKSLCPAIVAIITDDVNQSVRSLFGRVKNTPWRLVEVLVEQGNSSKVLCNLVKDLQNLEFLDSAWLKFNAFIFGLLNHRALDFWLTYMCNNEKFIMSNYQATSFVSLSQTTARQEFLDMMTSLQPLAKVPFRLEYNFEYKHIKACENEALSNMLLEKHTTSSVDARLEQLLQQQSLGQSKGLNRQFSADEALSQQDKNSPLRDSIQERMSDTLKQYSPAIQQTKERTKTLLMVTGQQIKDKFKQIQKQNKSGNESGTTMVTSNTGNGAGIGGGLKPKSVAPLKAPRLFNGVNCENRDNQVVSNGVRIQPENKNFSKNAKDDTAIISNTVQEVLPRSRSLDIIPVLKDKDVSSSFVSSNLTTSSKNNSLSDLVNYFGKKIFSFTSATPPPKPPRTYKAGITSYQFESEASQMSSVSGSCDTGLSTKESFHNDQSKETDSDICSKDSDSRSASTPSMNTEVYSGNNTSDSDICSSKQLEQSNTTSCASSVSSSAPPTEFYVPCESNATSSASSLCSVNSNYNIQPNNMETRPEFTAVKILNPSANPAKDDASINKAVDSNFSRTANFFKRKLGPTLINVFDKLLLEKKGPGSASTLPRPKSSQSVKNCEVDIVDECTEVTTTSVRRSVSAMEFPRKQVQALCSYVATEQDELSFNKGSLLSVVKDIDEDWLLCNSGNNKGLVHKGCVKKLDAS